VLVDWDTVALAPQERDLWMLGESTDQEVDEAAMDFFRLAWDLGDLAAFTHELRIPHSENADTTKALAGIEYCLAALAAGDGRLTDMIARWQARPSTA
jgi:spectinomycin phosphotransferase